MSIRSSRMCEQTYDSQMSNEPLTILPHHPHDEEEVSEMSNTALWEAYQHAKSQGPQWRLDDIQLEIAERWEAKVAEEYDI